MLLARLLASELMLVHPTVRANGRMWLHNKANLERYDRPRILSENQGHYPNERWVDLTQRAHCVPRGRTAYYVVEPMLLMR